MAYDYRFFSIPFLTLELLYHRWSQELRHFCMFLIKNTLVLLQHAA